MKQQHAFGTEEAAATPDIPDSRITEAYEKAAVQNVLAAINTDVFFGYFSVCADGVGFGFGNTYPALDGHQLTDALLWLGKTEVVLANWEYVKGFQKPDGRLPFAILPDAAGKKIGPPGAQAQVNENGGLYVHWVPGDPLRALGYTTYIQNADVIFRFIQDQNWLKAQLPSVNLAAEQLVSLITEEGFVGGAGYYVERPTRIEYDGVTQCYAADAFMLLKELNVAAGCPAEAGRYEKIAEKIRSCFNKNFREGDRFAEYIHPDRGPVTSHGLSDTDWSAVATGMMDDKSERALFAKLCGEKRFYYGGMPTGIAALPSAYEKWESTYDDCMDIAAMGRVWYTEARARARMGDADGLYDTVLRVCEEGKRSGYYWRERYNEKGGYGAEKYCEYPANLIRIIQRFMLGVKHRTDGSLKIGPNVPPQFWEKGFGQTLAFRDCRLSYRMQRGHIWGEYAGTAPLKITARLSSSPQKGGAEATADGRPIPFTKDGGWLTFTLPATKNGANCKFTAVVHGIFLHPRRRYKI